jgi:hypothetical protein
MTARNDPEQNKQTLLVLQQEGADLSLPHRVEHMFRGSAAKLREVETRLSSSGFDINYRAPEVLIAAEWTVLDLDEINEDTAAMAKLARKLACSYEGWGSAPRRTSGAGDENTSHTGH